MTTQPPLQLTPENRQRLALLAEREGKSINEALAERLRDVPLSADESEKNSVADRTALDAFRDAGLVGAMDGPSDLSTNPKHMEGFGRNGPTSDTG